MRAEPLYVWQFGYTGAGMSSVKNAGER